MEPPFSNENHRLESLADKIESRFQCPSCPKLYKCKGWLWSHMNLKHNRNKDLKPWKCKFCSKSFNKSEFLTNHELIHLNEKRYNCEYCQKGFIQKGHLKEHLTMVHGHPHRFQCSGCGRKFWYRTSLVHHGCAASGIKKKHSQVSHRIQCSICGKTVQKKHLSVHNRNHTGEKPYQCPHCQTSFKQLSNMRTHIKVHHENANSSRGHKLSDHSSVQSDEKLFPCPMKCGEKFSSRKYVRFHVQNFHKQVKKKLQCRFCPELFAGFTNRKSHEHYRHGQGEKRFKCPQCDMKFFTKNDMESHERRHNNDRQFKCETCGKMFYAADELNNHRIRHLGIRSFRCDQCEKSFVMKADLTAHVKRLHLRSTSKK